MHSAQKVVYSAGACPQLINEVIGVLPALLKLWVVVNVPFCPAVLGGAEAFKASCSAVDKNKPRPSYSP